MNNLRLHAFDEFRAAGWIDENGNNIDEMQQAITELPKLNWQWSWYE